MHAETAELPVHGLRESGAPRGDEPFEIKQPPARFHDTQKLLKRLERAVGMPVIAYWGAAASNVCDNDVVVLHEILKRRGRMKKVGFLIKSGGGFVVSALKIVHLLRQYADEVTALLPLECASAATIIALGCDRIVMTPVSYLTPIDSSLTHQLSPVDEINNSRVSVSSDELRRITDLWRKLERDQHPNAYQEVFKYIHPLVIGAIDRSMSLSMKVCMEVLSYHAKDMAEAERISRSLNHDFPAHSYPITSQEAKRMGLAVEVASPQIDMLLSDLNFAYSDMAQNSVTDLDPSNYQDNNILSVVETKDCQIYWQNDRLQNYIASERRWQTLNNRSSWRMLERLPGHPEPRRSELHVR
jgi:hypothetical protein